MIGQSGVLSKEYPWLFLPRRFFCGLVEVPQYNYDWGYSKAYIELLCMDTTIIQYPEDKKGGSIADREKAAEEAKMMYYNQRAQKKQQNTTIKLKD